MLKKRNYYWFLFILFLLSFNALRISGQEFNAGIYAGLSAAQLDGDTYDGYNKPAAMAGAYVNRFLSKKLAFQFGLRYAQKGSRRINSEDNQYYKCDLHYAEIPLTVRYFYYKKLDFEAGVSVDYLIKAREDINANGWKDANPPFNKFELGSILGLSYHISKKVTVSTHFLYSITPARTYSSDYATYMDKGQHNNVINFSLHYLLSTWR